MCVQRVNFEKRENRETKIKKQHSGNEKGYKSYISGQCKKRKRYPDVNWRGNQKQVIKIVRRRIKTNQYIIGKEIIIRNNGCVLTFCHKCKKIQEKNIMRDFWKCFEWDKNSLFEVDTVSRVHVLIDKGMNKKSTSKTNRGTTSG